MFFVRCRSLLVAPGRQYVVSLTFSCSLDETRTPGIRSLITFYGMLRARDSYARSCWTQLEDSLRPDHTQAGYHTCDLASGLQLASVRYVNETCCLLNTCMESAAATHSRGVVRSGT